MISPEPEIVIEQIKVTMGVRFMCGRYHIDEDVEKEIYSIVQEIDTDRKSVWTGDIYPSQIAPVIYGRRDRFRVTIDMKMADR